MFVVAGLMVDVGFQYVQLSKRTVVASRKVRNKRKRAKKILEKALNWAN